MSGALNMLLSNRGIASITSSGGWSATGTTATITTVSRTLTVPSGNPGMIQLNISPTGCSQQYKINTGLFTGFANGAVISITNGDSLIFRITGSGSGSTSIGGVDDNTTGANVALVDIENTL